MSRATPRPKAPSADLAPSTTSPAGDLATPEIPKETSGLDPTPASFEQSLIDLEGIVDALERGELTLEESLAAFERGISLSRACQNALDQAEQRVRILTDTRPGTESDREPEPFAPSPGDTK